MGHRLRQLAILIVLTGCGLASGEDLSAAPSHSWRSLPRPPIAGRLPAATVWTGTEMIVWGGITRPGLAGSPYAQASGAAYDPRTRRWRMISRAPAGVRGGGGSAAAWTGHEMAVWVGNSPEGPAAAATYDPRKNTWRRLPTGPLGVREDNASVWTGSELLVFGGHTGAVTRPTGAALEARRRTWRRLPGLEAIRGLAVANGAVWDGHEAFVAGQLSASPAQPPRAILFAFSPKSDKVRRIDLSKAPVGPSERLHLYPIAWTGRDVLLLIGARSASSRIMVVRYDPTMNRWRNGRAAPCTGPTQTAWIGKGVVGACGTKAIEIYSAHANRWERIPSGPSPLASKQGSAVVWTGSQLIVWSGIVDQPGNPTPPDGASITLAG